MRLVLATLNFPPTKGGIEQLCSQLADALHALGVDVTVIAPAAPGDAAYDAAKPYRLQRYVGGSARHVNLARALDTELRVAPARVLFGQWTAAGLPLVQDLLAKRRTGFSALGHAKELLPAERGVRSTELFARYRRAVLGQMHPMFCVSRYSAEAARAAGASDVELLHPGVDSVRFAPAQGDAATSPRLTRLPRPVLLTVARLVSRKGIDTVIEALPDLLRAHPTLTYAVVGEGPDEARLRALAQRLGVSDHVALLGSADHAELPVLYRSADLFVLASRQESRHGDVEGFGLVLLEAQACGTPVIAADSGGMPDALLPGQTGLLVPPDSPKALAAAASALLADARRLAAMREAARAHALTCSWMAAAERCSLRLGLRAR